MTPLVCVDVGNSRLKWGWSDPAFSPSAMISLPLDDVQAWRQAAARLFAGPVRWAVAGSNPERRDEFAAWAAERGEVRVFATNSELPIRIDLRRPEAVGIDRLLNAIAASARLGLGEWAVVADAGTAVTVDFVRPGVFGGGAILPGPRLMFDALHRHTARLPLLTDDTISEAEFPGHDTEQAIRTGVGAAILGAVRHLVDNYSKLEESPPHLIFTGGGFSAVKEWLGDPNDPGECRWDNLATAAEVPTLTLDGIRIAAEHAWPPASPS